MNLDLLSFLTLVTKRRVIRRSAKYPASNLDPWLFSLSLTAFVCTWKDHREENRNLGSFANLTLIDLKTTLVVI